MWSGTNAFICSIEVVNFDETAKIILANGGAVAVPKMAVPGRCWQGYFWILIKMYLEYLRRTKPPNDDGSDLFGEK
jgi:hypothetical protein